jgi:hypothetical protein
MELRHGDAPFRLSQRETGELIAGGNRIDNMMMTIALACQAKQAAA